MNDMTDASRAETSRKTERKPRISEDWLSLWTGLVVFVLSLGVFLGADLLGFGAKVGTWTDLSKSITPVAASFKWMPAWLAVVSTYLFLGLVVGVGNWLLGGNLKRFIVAFTLVFTLSFACWVLGNHAYIAATTPAEWAAPLASGISICGVSAAIATGGAIRARPIVPIMVSSLVVVFAVVELLLLPFLAQTFLWKEPLVAGAWMGLAVKTDGAATAAGAVTDALILAKAAGQGVIYEKDWILNTATSIKVFIDIFIGIWAFVLAYIWANHIEKRQGDKVRAVEIWQRFPKFIIGYVLTFGLFLALGFAFPALIKTETTVPITKEVRVTDPATGQERMEKLPVMKEVSQVDPATGKSTLISVPATKKEIKPGPAKNSTEQANVFRVLFFCLTFFTIGVVSDFKRLWEEGIGKLAAVYVVGLFGFIIWFGLIISWMFFGGVHPPIIHP